MGDMADMCNEDYGRDDPGVCVIGGCSLVYETEKAWCVHSDDEEAEAWFPMSLCDWDEDNGEIHFPAWLAVNWN